MKIDLGHGAPVYVALRRDYGVTLHQGPSHIMLGPDELDAVLTAIDTLRSPRRAEKNTTIEPQKT